MYTGRLSLGAQRVHMRILGWWIPPKRDGTTSTMKFSKIVLPLYPGRTTRLKGFERVSIEQLYIQLCDNSTSSRSRHHYSLCCAAKRIKFTSCEPRGGLNWVATLGTEERSSFCRSWLCRTSSGTHMTHFYELLNVPRVSTCMGNGVSRQHTIP